MASTVSPHIFKFTVLRMVVLGPFIQAFSAKDFNWVSPLNGLIDVTKKMSVNNLCHCYSQQRLNQTKYRELLAQRAQQFRTIQRRLLTRFKDKTPAPLANLDTLLDGTYRQVNFSGILLRTSVTLSVCHTDDWNVSKNEMPDKWHRRIVMNRFLS